MSSKTMVKRILLVLVMAFLGGAAFSQEDNKLSPISIGIRAAIDFFNDASASSGPASGTLSAFQGGLSVFLDAKFVEFSVNLLFGGNTFHIKEWSEPPHDSSRTDVDYKLSGQIFTAGFSLLGKYPFKISFLTLAPALGIEYRFMAYGNTGGAYYLDNEKTRVNPVGSVFNSVLLKFGGIVDFDLTNRIYLRANILYFFPLGFYHGGGSGGPQIQFGVGYRL